MKSFLSWCSCRREVGQTDGAVLIIGGMEIRRPVTLWCACGAATYWRPVRERQDTAPVPTFERACYSEEEPTAAQIAAVKKHFPDGVAAAAAFLERMEQEA